MVSLHFLISPLAPVYDEERVFPKRKKTDQNYPTWLIGSRNDDDHKEKKTGFPHGVGHSHSGHHNHYGTRLHHKHNGHKKNESKAKSKSDWEIYLHKKHHNHNGKKTSQNKTAKELDGTFQTHNWNDENRRVTTQATIPQVAQTSSQEPADDDHDEMEKKQNEDDIPGVSDEMNDSDDLGAVEAKIGYFVDAQYSENGGTSTNTSSMRWIIGFSLFLILC